MNPAITVIIPSYNSKRTIRQCLESVLRQKTKISHEIIVVDSSDDKTDEIIRGYGPRIKLIHKKKKTLPGEARNIGIRKAKGKFVALIDADCVADENWLSRIYDAHKKHEIVGGRIMNGNPSNLIGWSLFLSEFSDFIGNKNKIVDYIPTCNISYNKKIFQKYGFFPEDIFPSEDLIFNLHVKEPKLFSNSILIKHINRTSLLAVVKHSYKLGYTDALARRRANLVGKIAVKYKILIPLLIAYRFLKIGYNSLKSNALLIFLLTSPLILICLLSWDIGFFTGTLKKD
jgi:glycosyltransferase involved in cell wall biosynthesis